MRSCKAVAVLLLLCVVPTSLLAGIGSSDAMYVGGTVSSIPEKTEGKPRLETNEFVFESKKATLRVPYSQVNSLEYGQKAGRRLGLAIAVSPLFLFSKKRKHFLTVGFLDKDGKQQAAVFELGKSVIRSTLDGLEQRTGKKIDYEDAEARKSADKK
jgi:hypothetical protein